MTPAQNIALGNYLSAWDDTKSYDEILEAIAADDDDIATIWEPFEYHDPSDLIGFIEGLRYSVEQIGGQQ